MKPETVFSIVFWIIAKAAIGPPRLRSHRLASGKATAVRSFGCLAARNLRKVTEMIPNPAPA